MDQSTDRAGYNKTNDYGDVDTSAHDRDQANDKRPERRKSGEKRSSSWMESKVKGEEEDDGAVTKERQCCMYLYACGQGSGKR